MAKQAETEAPTESPRIPDELAEDIFQARTVTKRLEEELARRKGQAKESKESLDLAQDDLNRLIDEAAAGTGPLFENSDVIDGEEAE